MRRQEWSGKSPEKVLADLAAPTLLMNFQAAQQFISALVWSFSGQPWSRRDRRAFANSVRRRPRRVQHDGRVTR